jgi:hypothetical protein
MLYRARLWQKFNTNKNPAVTGNDTIMQLPGPVIECNVGQSNRSFP